jgi:hypothetical protein
MAFLLKRREIESLERSYCPTSKRNILLFLPSSLVVMTLPLVFLNFFLYKDNPILMPIFTESSLIWKTALRSNFQISNNLFFHQSNGDGDVKETANIYQEI